MATDNTEIKVEKLINGDQRQILKYKIKIILSAADLFKYVTGDEVKPTEYENYCFEIALIVKRKRLSSLL